MFRERIVPFRVCRQEEVDMCPKAAFPRRNDLGAQNEKTRTLTGPGTALFCPRLIAPTTLLDGKTLFSCGQVFWLPDLPTDRAFPERL